MIKNLALMILGAIICLAIVFAVKLKAFHSSVQAIRLPMDNFYLDDSSKEEREVFYQIKEYYEQGKAEKLNELIGIKKGEVKIEINGPKSFPQPHTPVAELIIKNISNRDLIVFDPILEKVTTESYISNGYIQDDYNIACPITVPGKCNIIKAGQTLSFPVFFEVSGTGSYKLNLSLGFTIYTEITETNVRSNTPIIDYTNYVFDIL